MIQKQTPNPDEEEKFSYLCKVIQYIFVWQYFYNIKVKKNMKKITYIIT